MTQPLTKSDGGRQPSNTPELLGILEQSGAELHGCQLAMDMFKLKREDLASSAFGPANKIRRRQTGETEQRSG